MVMEDITNIITASCNDPFPADPITITLAMAASDKTMSDLALGYTKSSRCQEF